MVGKNCSTDCLSRQRIGEGFKFLEKLRETSSNSQPINSNPLLFSFLERDSASSSSSQEPTSEKSESSVDSFEQALQCIAKDIFELIITNKDGVIDSKYIDQIRQDLSELSQALSKLDITPQALSKIDLSQKETYTEECKAAIESISKLLKKVFFKSLCG